MNYAFMSSSTPSLSLPQMLQLAQELGYQGVELRAEWGHAHGVELALSTEQRRVVREALRSSPIALCCIATGCRYADPQASQQQVEQTRRYIDLASDLGCPRLRIFGGAIPQAVGRERAIEQLVRSLEQIAPHAQSRGVTVCLETHDDWTDPRHCAQVMRQVNHPAIGILWDIMHPLRQSDWSINAAYEVLRPWIRHVHFHDGLKRLDKTELRPMGQGEIDHRAAVRGLLRDGYGGFLSGEWIDWEPQAQHLPRELAAMRRYEQEWQKRTVPAKPRLDES